ncbi:MAG: DNA-formamidopyrimidine glycosylase [Candidatus Taylorbacteria bacterium]|nr:DNA-formamidopyrimidine glycosylase [Candidatus Taylorbacteria bacterium]
MPELPEVHTTATILNKLISRLTIIDVWSGYNSSFHKGKDNIKNIEYFKKFKREIIGKKIVNVSRRGKNVLINLEKNTTILVHMKMTGHLLYGRYEKRKTGWTAIEKGPLQNPFSRFIRLIFTLSDEKHLAFSDMRKFAKVCLIKTDELEKSGDLRELGPEPLEKKFTFEKFMTQINKKSKGKIKQVLMDQSVIAGIGNIYSDEILWQSSLHPETRTEKIPGLKLKLIFKAIKEILKKGVELKGDSMSDYRNPYGEKGQFQNTHKAYRRIGQVCEKKGCKGIIKKIKVGGRSAHFCSEHQHLPS